MSEDLNTQIATRLFGFAWDEGLSCWLAPEPMVSAETTPAYTTDPAATALVWQWLEQQRGLEDWSLAFDYWAGKVSCRLAKWNTVYTLAHEEGATWPEALCRAALALADAD